LIKPGGSGFGNARRRGVAGSPGDPSRVELRQQRWSPPDAAAGGAPRCGRTRTPSVAYDFPAGLPPGPALPPGFIPETPIVPMPPAGSPPVPALPPELNPETPDDVPPDGRFPDGMLPAAVGGAGGGAVDVVGAGGAGAGAGGSAAAVAATAIAPAAARVATAADAMVIIRMICLVSRC
jgi:hypothetical protein